jgi:hypothetical protein
MKFRHVALVGTFFLLLGAFVFGGTPPQDNLGQNSSVNTVNQWRSVGGYIKTASSTAGLQVTGLASCDTIDTDADGKMSCGTDDGGGTASFSTTSTNYWAQNALQLGQISDVSTTTLATGYVLKWSGTAWESVATSSLNIGGGTVNSVDMSVPTGLTISGNPVTTSGTLAVAYTAGYSIPKTASTTEGTTAYLWGNHASAGYLTLSAFYATTTQDIAEGGTNLYYLDSRVNAYVHGSTTIPKTYTNNTFIGTQTLNNASTTQLTVSGKTWLTYASTTAITATNFYGALTGTASGNTTETSMNAYIHASTTIPKTYTANTFTGLQTIGNASTTHTSVSGSLFAGTVRTGTWNGTGIGVAYGGTGASTIGRHMILAYNGTSIVASSSPQVAIITATSTTASSSLQWVTATAFGIAGKFFASATQFVVNLTANFTAGLVVLDFLDIPSSTNPTVDAEGELAINTTQASSTIRFHDGTAERSASDRYQKTLKISSSTILALGRNPAGTSTIVLDKALISPITHLARYCETTTGTWYYRIGNGTASSSCMACTTSGVTETITNGTFTYGSKIYLEVGPITGATSSTIVIGQRYDAD